jgi:PEGA domain-containing protein
MGPAKNMLRLLSMLFLVCLLCGSLCRGALADELAHPYYPLHFKVIRADFRPLTDANPVPKNCDMENFDAYCNESRNISGEAVMVVQDAHGNSYTISCTVDSRWSRCSALAVGETFDARKEKGGLTIVYEDSHGRDKKEFFHLVDTTPAPPTAAAATDSQAKTAAASSSTSSAAPPRTGVSAQPVSSALGPRFGQENSADTVRCTFSTTPPGAEISLDGKYVGNTPSEITVTTGAHTVVYTLAGFASWKHDLTVLPASELNVSAVLQKQ